jgi:hypothetical protein
LEALELPLKSSSDPSAQCRLVFSSTRDPKVFGATEPWFDLDIIAENGNPTNARATQPLSCFQAVSKGRKTAMICASGIIALYMDGDHVRVDFQHVSGSRLSACCSAASYSQVIEALASQ